MKWLLLGCFQGSHKPHAKDFEGPQPLVTCAPPHGHAVNATSTDTAPGSAALPQPHNLGAASTVPARLSSGQEARNREGGTSSSDVDALGNHGQADSVQRARITANQASVEAQEAPALRLSLDCGVGIGPSTPDPPSPSRPPSTNLSFSRLPASANTNSISFMMRGSVDTASAETGAESFRTSDSSSGALVVRGNAAASVLCGDQPGDAPMSAGSRHLVSRAFRGRASLDALLMLGALVRAADEAGLAVTGMGSSPRLERIESGDLPPGEDGHLDRQPQPHHPRQKGPAASATTAATAAAAAAAASAVVGEMRTEWRAEAGPSAGPRLAPRPQRRTLRWSQSALNGSISGDWAPGGGRNRNECRCGGGGGGGDVGLCESSLSGGVGPAGAHAATAACANTNGAALVPTGNPDFTFSPPTVGGSLRQSVDNSRGQHSDAILSQLPYMYGQHHGQVQGGLGGHLAENSQILDLFMRLVTNCSTVGDSDLPSSSGGCDRSSAGTTGTAGAAHGARAGTATGALPLQLPPPSVRPPGGLAAPAVGHRKPPHVQRSASERHRHGNGRRWAGVEGAGGGSAHSAATAAAAAAALTALKSHEGGSSAPLLKLHGNHGNLLAGGGSNPSGSGGGYRRNSWDTLGGSSGSAMAVAAAAAAALAATGLLRGSASSRTAATATAAAAAAGGSTSGRTTGSASMFWPVGGVFQEDSGPASMLLLGALSGGMSLGGSATSLVQLPTGSGSVRDVLSRIQQQQLSLQEGGGPAATSSSSWSAQTGLASLFDAHLTAALRRNGAVRTFKRALGGVANLSQTSSVTSQVTGNLGRQDTASLTLTSGLMMLNFGSTAGSSAAGGVGSGGGGVSQLGAASAAAGILFSGLQPPPQPQPQPPQIRQETISSISTINSNPDAGGGGGGAAVRSGNCNDNEEGSGRGSARSTAAAAAAARRRGPGYQMSLISDSGTLEAPPRDGLRIQRQLRAFVERQAPQPHSQHPQHPHQQSRLHLHHQQHPHSSQPQQRAQHHYHHYYDHHQQQLQQQQQQQQQVQQLLQAEEDVFQRRQGGHAGLPAGNAIHFSGDGAAAAAAAARNPSVSGALPHPPPLGYEERGSLSLALGLAVGIHGGGGGAGGGTSVLMHLPAKPAGAGAAAAAAASGGIGAQSSRSSSPLAEVSATDRSMAAGALAAGPVGAAWLQPPPPLQPPPRGRGLAAMSEMSTSMDFSRYSWETDWGPTGRGAERGEADTFTFTGPGSSVFQGRSP